VKISITVDDTDLKKLVLEKLRHELPNGHELDLEHLTFQVKPRNNYRQQEWETGQLRVVGEAEL
jgi:hypothetical protein